MQQGDGPGDKERGAERCGAAARSRPAPRGRGTQAGLRVRGEGGSVRRVAVEVLVSGDRDRLAAHESGHVVAAAALGLPIERVALGPGHGKTLLHPPPLPAEDYAQLAWLSVQATVAAAGAAGEAEWWESPAGQRAMAADRGLCFEVRAATASTDDAKLDLYAEQAALYCGADPEEWAGRRRVEAAAILAAHGARAGLIAEALARAGELSGDALGAVLGWTDGGVG